MDIFSFINSSAVREHLKVIDYKFSAIEASWIVWQCGNATLKEKIGAWKWIIANMPDEEVKARMNITPHKSLHQRLVDYIELKERQIKEFYDNSNAVYQVRYYYEDDLSWSEGSTVFASPDGCWKQLHEEWTDEDIQHIVEVVITKKVIDDSNYKVDVNFRYDGAVMDIDVRGAECVDEDLENCFFEGFWFCFPVPFKEGDIVEPYNAHRYNMDRDTVQAFVLKGTQSTSIAQNPEQQKKYMDDTFMDSSDMIAWGYFMEEDGRVYEDHTTVDRYIDLEYYEGDFDGKKRMLKAVSNYVKDNISLELLLSTYRKVIIDEFAKDVMLTNWYTEEGLELAGIKQPKE